MRPFHPLFILEIIPELVTYLPVTLGMVLGTVLFGGIWGFLLALAKVRRRPVAKALAEIYTYVTRCVPSVVMLFVVFYGLPELLLSVGINLNGAGNGFFVIAAFSILYAANISEVFRAAYLAIDKGQREAAVSIGLTEAQAFRRIVLPQSIVVAIPNFTNSLINLMKEGALAYTIGLIDIVGQGNRIIGRYQGSYTLEVYLALAALYWIMTIMIQKLFGAVEKKLSRGKKGLTTAA